MVGLDEEIKELFLKQQHEWYKFIPALFEIVKELKGHTLDILSSKLEETKFGVRYFFAGTIDYLKKHLDAMSISDGTKLINLYRSIAHLKGNIPIFTYALSERKSDPRYIQFDKEFVDLIDGFDLVFDIDSPKKDVTDAWGIAKQIKAILDEYKVPYYVKSSGTRGWHFIIPYNYMPEINPLELQSDHYKVLYNIAGIYEWSDYIDCSVASHPKTLIKCSYAFDSGNISLPMSDIEFENFSPEKIKMEWVLKNVILKNRGLMTRTHGLSEEELRKNVKKFLDDFK
jgi:hypothetical protein